MTIITMIITIIIIITTIMLHFSTLPYQPYQLFLDDNVASHPSMFVTPKNDHHQGGIHRDDHFPGRKLRRKSLFVV